jgi:hypothetical protein
MRKRRRSVPARGTKSYDSWVYRKLTKMAALAFNQFIRERDSEIYPRCPLCNERPIQCCFHFCRYKWCPMTRLDEVNAVGACHKCNWIEYRNPDPSRAWYISKHGVQQYLDLVKRSKEKFVPTVEYLAKQIVRFDSSKAAKVQALLLSNDI